MSGVKRKIEDNDPDYEEISLIHNSKKNKADEQNGKFILQTLRFIYMQLMLALISLILGCCFVFLY